MTKGVGTLLVICGLPGAGKTGLATRLEETRKAVRLSADEWMTALAVNLHDEDVRARVEALQWVVGKRLLALEQTVIVEWGTWGRWERDALRKEARAVGARVVLYYLDAPAEELFGRIQRRAMEDPPITWERVQQWSAIFEAPTSEEGALFDVYVPPALGKDKAPH